jgi:hypothetical protein
MQTTGWIHRRQVMRVFSGKGAKRIKTKGLLPPWSVLRQLVCAFLWLIWHCPVDHRRQLSVASRAPSRVAHRVGELAIPDPGANEIALEAPALVIGSLFKGVVAVDLERR